MSTGMKAALVGIPLLLLAGGGAVVMMKSSGGGTPVQQPPQQVATAPETPPVKPPEPKPPPPEQPKPATPAVIPNVKVTVTSKPSGAALFNEEGIQIGTTPADLVLPRDNKHRITFRADGHQSVDRLLDFSLVASDSVTVDVTLSPTPRATTKKPPKQGPDITTFE
jgi:serine/threonine-protein kinase